MEGEATAAALWGAVVLSGIYHGANPGMGWPLAVSAALMERRGRAFLRALAALAAGHFAAMVAILLPFSAMVALVAWEREIRIGAALLVTAFGLALLIWRRHPRFLSRVPPSRLALWSFLAATAHGAGLMLVPIYLGLCATVETDPGHAAAARLMGSDAARALLVAALHTLAMTAAGGALAWAVWRWLGLEALRRGWFNLDMIWAASLVLVGAVSLVAAL